jgi:hypothetical protein
LENIRNYYDGYFFGYAKNLYNPLSVNKFFKSGEFGYYWVETGSQEFIQKFFSCRRVTVEEFEKIPIDYKEILTPGEISLELDAKSFLYQAGYLTVRIDDGQELVGGCQNIFGSIDDTEVVEKTDVLKVDGDDKIDLVYYLTYPNHEVRAAMFSLVTKNYFNSKETAQIKNDFKLLLRKSSYAEAFFRINSALKAIPHFDSTIAKRNKSGQWYYRGPVIAFLYATGMFIIPEFPSTLGRSDILFLYDRKAYVIELKTASGERNSQKKLVEAWKQMDGKKYGERFPDPVLVGIVVDEKQRLMTHMCIGTEAYHIVKDALHPLKGMPDIEAALAGKGRTAKR